jgi:hypothetical protein
LEKISVHEISAHKACDLFRCSERRTKVIDDESDYFTVNSVWLSKAEWEKLQQHEEELHAKRHTSRLDRRVTLDFAGLCFMYPHAFVFGI